MSNPTKSKSLQHNSCVTKKFTKPYKCKAMQGSHKDRSNSTMSGENFSFKVPPRMSFPTLIAHVLLRDMIRNQESTNPGNFPRPIFKWTQHKTPFYHITPRTKCRIQQNQRSQQNTTHVLPKNFQRNTNAESPTRKPQQSPKLHHEWRRVLFQSTSQYELRYNYRSCATEKHDNKSRTDQPCKWT
jgi:hypothetical protein